MAAILDSTAQSSAGNVSSFSWTHTILKNTGNRGLVLVMAGGREQTGDHDPEHPSSASFNGVGMSVVENTGSNETAGALFYLTGSNVPGPGSYTVTVNYNGSGTAEYHRGISAVWRGVKNQAPEAHTPNTTNSGGRKQVSLTSLTNNALIVGAHWWRVGFAETQYSDFNAIAIERGDNALGTSLYAKTGRLAGGYTFDIDAGNTEDQALFIASFATFPQYVPGGMV